MALSASRRIQRATDCVNVAGDAADLGLDGDNLFDTMALLQLDFGVDLSGLEWSRYAPSEGEKLSWMWYWRLLQRVLGAPKPQYRPLTLQMIREALHSKQWTFG